MMRGCELRVAEMKSRSVSSSAAGGLAVPVAVVLGNRETDAALGKPRQARRLGGRKGIQTKTPSVNLPPRATALRTITNAEEAC
jgi:hypothetical protein